MPKDNLLRQIKELVDFSFIYDELVDKYCLDNGRNAVLPVRMFKYLLLKTIFNLSNVDVVERSKYDIRLSKDEDARLNSIVTQGNRTKEDEFIFNKDTGMYQCKAGNIVIHSVC